MRPETKPANRLSAAALAALIAERPVFQRFLARRLGNEADANDLLQDSFLRAMRRGDRLRDDARVIPWFYRMLRRAVADHFRDRAAFEHRLQRFATERLVTDEETASAPQADLRGASCACFKDVLPSLSDRAAKLIRRIDLNGEPRAAIGREFDLSPSSLDVAVHRARATLRRQLETFCGPCAKESCLACICEAAHEN